MFLEAAVLNIINAGVIILNQKSEVVFWNKWMTKHSFVDQEDAIKKSIFTLFPSLESSKFERCLSICLKRKQSSILSDTLNKQNQLDIYTDQSKLNRLKQKILISPFLSSSGDTHCLIQIEDKTKIRKKEYVLTRQSTIVDKQNLDLEEAKKLGEIGKMSAGIVHEINNPMTIINGCSERLREMEPVKKENLITVANKIDEMTIRIRKIINGLKIIAHEELKTLDDHSSISDLIQESISLTKLKVEKAKVHIKVDTFPHDWKIWCDRVQISQIFINLINNAVDEIRKKHENPWIEFSVREAGDFYEICVTDCGKGIPQKVQKNIFNAFVTSKKPGEGTGLGLSISKSIATIHNGDLYIDNGMAHTTFVTKIYKDVIWENMQKSS
jgi:C4-dicarboxylate-specific signal transduction histidine kinase